MGADIPVRRAELRLVVDWCGDGAHGVAVAGRRGTGRSVLLRAVEQQLADGRWGIQRLMGSAATQAITFGAMASVLPDHLPDGGAAAIKALVGALARSEEGSLLTVDDADLLDDASVAVLLELVSRSSVTVVFAFDVDGLRSGALDDLLRAPHVRRIDLAPLSTPDTAALAAHELGDAVTPAVARDLNDLVRGDAALLSAALADLATAGTLVRRDGRWEAIAALEPGPAVAQVVRDRLQRFPVPLRGALERLAVVEPVVPGSLLGLEPSVIAAMEQRGVAGLVDTGTGMRAVITPPLLGTAVRAALAPARRLELLLDLAGDIPDDRDLDRSLADRLVRAFEDAQVPLPVALAGAVANAAFLALDLDGAQDLARDVAARHWRAAFVLGEAARTHGDHDKALDWFDIAATLARTDHAIARVALAASGVLVWHLHQPQRAHRILEETMARLTDERIALELGCEAAFVGAFLGGYAEAVEIFRLVLAEPDLDDLAAWNASICLAYMQVMGADVTGLGAVLTRAEALIRAVTEEHTDSADLHAALTVGFDTLRGDLPGAAQDVHECRRRLPGECGVSGMTSAVGVETLLLVGDPAALAVAESAVEQLRGWDPLGALPMAEAYVALVSALRDDHRRARQIVLGWTHRPENHRASPVLARAEAVLGLVEDPVGRLVASGVAACEAGHVTPGVLALVDALWWGGHAEVAARAPALLPAGRSPLADLVLRLVDALSRGDAAAADAVAAEAWRMGAVTIAGGGFRRAAALHPPGVEARRAAARADVLAADMAPLTLPGLEVDIVGGLTDRETDIARRAARGQSNAEIAAETFLSARTVGNHLQHVYDKLEVRGRTELTGLLGPAPTR